MIAQFGSAKYKQATIKQKAKYWTLDIVPYSLFLFPVKPFFLVVRVFFTSPTEIRQDVILKHEQETTKHLLCSGFAFKPFYHV